MEPDHRLSTSNQGLSAAGEIEAPLYFQLRSKDIVSKHEHGRVKPIKIFKELRVAQGRPRQQLKVSAEIKKLASKKSRKKSRRGRLGADRGSPRRSIRDCDALPLQTEALFSSNALRLGELNALCGAPQMMREEIRPSGLEGGGALCAIPTPITGFFHSPGKRRFSTSCPAGGNSSASFRPGHSRRAACCPVRRRPRFFHRGSPWRNRRSRFPR